MSEDNKIITFNVGGRGCGKSERARKNLGMTHEEYEKYCKEIQKLIDSERESRDLLLEVAARSHFHLMQQLEREHHNEMNPPVTDDPLRDILSQTSKKQYLIFFNTPNDRVFDRINQNQFYNLLYTSRGKEQKP